MGDSEHRPLELWPYRQNPLIRKMLIFVLSVGSVFMTGVLFAGDGGLRALLPTSYLAFLWCVLLLVPSALSVTPDGMLRCERTIGRPLEVPVGDLAAIRIVWWVGPVAVFRTKDGRRIVANGPIVRFPQLVHRLRQQNAALPVSGRWYWTDPPWKEGPG